MHRGRSGAAPGLAAGTARGHNDSRRRVRGGHGVASSLGSVLDRRLNERKLGGGARATLPTHCSACLLYTSDAADDM
eukprot:8070865-Alexandrium_andersonii.AAC.1